MGRGKKRQLSRVSPRAARTAGPPCRVVLSRKGFDTGSGGGASPVLPDGRMLSLPIPDSGKETPYGSLELAGRPLLALMHELGYTRFRPRFGAHLDPDLLASTRERRPGWLGMLGQVDQSASHLARQAVRQGDLFLFWGRFRKTNASERGLRFQGPPFHAIFGYLEVDAVCDPEDQEAPAPEWADGFAHLDSRYSGRKNRIYVAREQASWDSGLPGFGVFRYSEELCLTAPGGSPSQWLLPEACHPERGASLSYHDNASRWGKPVAGRAQLQSVARGQEFVFQESQGVSDWARGLVSSASRWQ
jgi:hypothetical protein